MGFSSKRNSFPAPLRSCPQPGDLALRLDPASPDRDGRRLAGSVIPRALALPPASSPTPLTSCARPMLCARDHAAILSSGLPALSGLPPA